MRELPLVFALFGTEIQGLTGADVVRVDADGLTVRLVQRAPSAFDLKGVSDGPERVTVADGVGVPVGSGAAMLSGAGRSLIRHARRSWRIAQRSGVDEAPRTASLRRVFRIIRFGARIGTRRRRAAGLP